MTASSSSVSLACLGLDASETYEQIIESLLSLDDAVHAALDHVQQRVAEERASLRGIEARIEAVKKRVDQVVGSRAATVVLSASRSLAMHVPCTLVLARE